MGSALIACGALCPVARATAPELVREWNDAFDELVWDGSVLWLCDHADSIAHELIALTGVTADGQEVSRAVPAGTFRVGTATDGTLFATAWGTETDCNPSVWLWRFQSETGWQSIAQIFGANTMVGVNDATILPFGEVVLIDLQVNWSIWDGGLVIVIGPPMDPNLVTFDTGSGEVSTSVPRADGVFATTEGAYCYSERTNTLGYCDLMRSVDGSTWAPVPRTMQPLDEYRGYIMIPGGPDLPDATSGSFGFSHGGSEVRVENWAANFSTTRTIPLSEHGYTPEALSAPPDIIYNGVVSKGLAVARGGECAAILLEFPSTNPSVTPAFQLVAMSFDFMQGFEFHQLNDLGHIDAVVTPTEIFLLRKTSSGSRLLRIPLPSEQLPTARARRISLTAGTQDVPTGFVRDPVTGLMTTQMTAVAIMDLGVEGTGEGPVQIQTSTDLKNWFNLGLPTNADAALRIFMCDRARFFR